MTEYVPAPMARGPDELVESILRAVDPRLAFAVRDELRAWRERTARPLSPSARWVLAGHRAAGKSTLLPLFAELSGRPGYDLDHEIESTHRRSIRDWLREDAQGFRAAERDGFRRLPARAVVAVGGGFLSLHADLLAGHEVILVPVSFETYAERLRADTTRPRLRPELSLEEELREMYTSREKAHAAVPTRSLAEALAALRGQAS